MKRPKGKELSELSKEELEKEKLIREVRSIGSLWRIPAFWTFLAFSLTATVGYTTGFFQTEKSKLELEKKINELENEKLDERKHFLTGQLDSLNEEYFVLQDDFDSLYIVTNKLLDVQDSVKRAYRIWEKKKQTRKELIQESWEVIEGLRTIVKDHEKCTNAADRVRDKSMYSELNSRQRDSLWQVFANMSTQCGRIFNQTYKERYFTKAVIVRDKLLANGIKPKKKSRGMVDFEHPTNPIGMEYIISELEYYVKLLEDL